MRSDLGMKHWLAWGGLLLALGVAVSVLVSVADPVSGQQCGTRGPGPGLVLPRRSPRR
jgi:hypothetical protein